MNIELRGDQDAEDRYDGEKNHGCHRKRDDHRSACAALVSMGTFANKGCSSQVDQTFSEVYEECSNISFDEVIDEYTSYAFLLKNVENVEIQNGLLSFTSDVLSELSESEVDLVYELAEKINTLIELDAIRIDTNLRIWEKAAPSIANVQILSGTSDISYWNSYFDDPADQRDIQRGIDRYNLEH